MIEIGSKIILGGRTFWCIDYDEETGQCALCSGANTITIPVTDLQPNTIVGKLTVGEHYTARGSIGPIRAGHDYKVIAYEDENVTLDSGDIMQLTSFAVLFA